VALLLAASGCDSSSTSPTVAKSFIGVVAVPGNAALAGALTLTTSGSQAAGSGRTRSPLSLVQRVSELFLGRPLWASPLAALDPASGSLELKSGATETLSGTFDSESGEFALAGSSFQFTGATTASSLVGTGTHPSTSLPLRVVGTAATTTATQTWGGTAISNPGQNCGNSLQSFSQFDFVLQQGSGSAWTVTGQVVNDGDGSQVTFKGTAQLENSGAGTIAITVDPPNDYAGAAGTLANGTWTGTYQGGGPSLCEVGTWSATRIN
jgi:hypothetical protein